MDVGKARLFHVGKWCVPLLAVAAAIVATLVYRSRGTPRPEVDVEPRPQGEPGIESSDRLPSPPAALTPNSNGSQSAKASTGHSGRTPADEPVDSEVPALPEEWASKVRESVDGVRVLEDPVDRFYALDRALSRLLSTLPRSERRLRGPLIQRTYTEFYSRETDDVIRAAVLVKLAESHCAAYAQDALAIFAKGIATPAGQNAARYLHRTKYTGFRAEVLLPTIEVLRSSESTKEKRLALLGLVEYQTDFPEAHDAMERAFLIDASPGVPELALELLSRQCSDSTLCELLGRTAIEGRTPSLRQAAVYLCLNAPGGFTDGRRALLERLSKEAPDRDVREGAVRILDHVARFDKEGRPPNGLLPK